MVNCLYSSFRFKNIGSWKLQSVDFSDTDQLMVIILLPQTTSIYTLNSRKLSYPLEPHLGRQVLPASYGPEGMVLTHDNNAHSLNTSSSLYIPTQGFLGILHTIKYDHYNLPHYNGLKMNLFVISINYC